MNEILGKRLLGACVLVGATIVLAKLLPSPQAVPPPEEHAKRVTYDLRSPVEVAKIEPPPASTPVASAEPQPEPTAPVEASPPPEHASEPPPVKASAPAPVPAPVAKTPAPPAAAKAATPKAATPKQVASKEAVPKEATAKPATAKPAWYLQIGAFAYQANAAKSVEKLRKAGLQPRQDTIAMKAGKRFRVRCGPFETEQQAQEEKAKAVQIGFADARVARD